MAVLRVTGLRSRVSRKPKAAAPSKPASFSKSLPADVARFPSKPGLPKNGNITIAEPKRHAPQPSNLRLYDNTMLSDFRRCPRMWLYRHLLGWRPEVPSSALIFGSSWHAAMDVVWRLICWERLGRKSDPDIIQQALEAFEETWEEEEGPRTLEEYSPDDYDGRGPIRSPETAHEMLIHYVRERRSHLTDPDLELLDIERPFAVPIFPDNPDLFYVGRLDKVTRFRGKLRIYEHKTTSMYAKSGGFQPRWISSFSPNTQVEGYLYAGSMLYGEPVKEVYVDGSLVHGSHHDVFRLIPIEKQWQQIDSWLWEASYWIQQLEANKAAVQQQKKLMAGFRKQGVSEAPRYLAAFPKNTNVCTDFSGCPYLDTCRVTADPMQRELPDGFTEKFWSPFDVLHLERIVAGNTLDNHAMEPAGGGKRDRTLAGKDRKLAHGKPSKSRP